MATAKKLPSGSWRCQVYDYTDANGKRHYKSFTSYNPTAKGKREAKRMAADYAYEKENRSHCSMTFGEAIEEITQERIQELINAKPKDRSPKTVRNIHGIISSGLKIYRPEMAL